MNLDILYIIFTEHLPIKDILKASLICREFNEITKQSFFWKELNARDFGIKDNTKEKYILHHNKTRLLYRLSKYTYSKESGTKFANGYNQDMEQIQGLSFQKAREMIKKAKLLEKSGNRSLESAIVDNDVLKLDNQRLIFGPDVTNSFLSSTCSFDEYYTYCKSIYHIDTERDTILKMYIIMFLNKGIYYCAKYRWVTNSHILHFLYYQLGVPLPSGGMEAGKQVKDKLFLEMENPFF